MNLKHVAQITGIIVMSACINMTGFANPAEMRASSFTLDQKHQIEGIVHEYLVTNPEVMAEVQAAYYQKKTMVEQAKLAGIIQTDPESIAKPKYSPVLGNVNGPVTLIEFFDYRCPYCVKVADTIDKLIQANPELRVVSRNFPVHGAEAELAARAGLAANLQDKYRVLNHAMLNSKESLTQENIIRMARAEGLDAKKLEKDLKCPNVITGLADDMKVVKKLQIRGTPMLIIMKTNMEAGSEAPVVTIPGAAELKDLKAAIERVKS